MAKKKKKIVKEQPFNPEVDTGLGRPVRSRVAVGDVNDKSLDLTGKFNRSVMMREIKRLQSSLMSS